jgi:hypothetical protein
MHVAASFSHSVPRLRSLTPTVLKGFLSSVGFTQECTPWSSVSLSNSTATCSHRAARDRQA